MSKKIIILIIIILSVSVFLFFRMDDLFFQDQKSFIQISGQKIEVTIRDDDIERQQGLSGKDSLCNDCGMLFIFEKARNYPFWMKEMKFDLDMLWIRGDKIVKIKENIPYQRGEGEVVNPEIIADKVLEINAGQSAKWEIKEGDKVIFYLK